MNRILAPPPSPPHRVLMTAAHDHDEVIVINVGGVRHEALLSTIRSRNGTRLSNICRKHVEGSRAEYFYDRHPGVFSAVIDYYRTGELHVPLETCGAVIKRELEFWRIDERLIEPCCWTNYSSFIDNQKTLHEFNSSVQREMEEIEAFQNTSGWRRVQMQIWMVLDHPRSSRIALTYAVASFVFVLASIVGFCLETLPPMHFQRNRTSVEECEGQAASATYEESHPALQKLDYVCTAYFSLEIFTRILFAPDKLHFCRSPMNIIDALALLPLYVQIILDYMDQFNCLSSEGAVIETIFILRIVRIARIFHLVKHYKALKILVHAIKASIQELLMLCIFLLIAMLLFSTLIFYAEHSSVVDHTEKTFNTIPLGFWWAIITMTTVGYGDMYPKTPLGCVVGAACAVWGVLLVTLTIPVISNNFTLFYLHARTRESVTPQERQNILRKMREKAASSDIEQNGEDFTENKCKTEISARQKHHNNRLLTHSRVPLLSAESLSTVDVIDEQSSLMLAKQESLSDDQNESSL